VRRQFPVEVSAGALDAGVVALRRHQLRAAFPRASVSAVDAKISERLLGEDAPDPSEFVEMPRSQWVKRFSTPSTRR